MIRLEGKPVRDKILSTLHANIETWKAKIGHQPGLTVILVGDDPASQVYVRNKTAACDQVGIVSNTISLPASTTQAELMHVIHKLNHDSSVHGILLQLPLPAGLDPFSAVAAIDPAKDVDGFHPVNCGRLMLGASGFRPCTPAGVMAMMAHYDINCAGKFAMVVGRSFIVGKPMALMLLEQDATVTIAHSKTPALGTTLRSADIVIVAIGKPGFVTADMIKPGAVVIDVGINRIDQKVVGDVDPSVANVASALTPVPGGVGPLTIAMLARNTGRAFATAHHLDFREEIPQ